MTNITYHHGDQVQTGDYFQYEVIIDKGETVLVKPANGHNVQWGEKWGETYEYKKQDLIPVIY